METPLIVIFKGQSQYDVLRSFADKLNEAFQQYGYRVAIIDFVESSAVQQLNHIIQNESVLFFFGIIGVGIEINIQGESLYDKLNVPYFGFFVDDPLHQWPRVSQKVHNAILSFVDRGHIKFLSSFLQSTKTKVFIPHATSLDGDDIESQKPIEDRELDIFLPGSWSKPDSARSKWLENGPIISKLMDDVAEYAYENWGTPLIKATEIIFSQKGLQVEDFLNNSLLHYLSLVDVYIRNKRREAAVLALKDFKLHLAGNGWGNLEGVGKHTVILPVTTYFDTLQTMKNSKLVLTVLPLFFEGSHERVFDAAASGAVSFTESSVYLREQFLDGHDLIFYDLKNIADKAAGALSDTERLNKIAGAGRAKTLENHQWVHRAANILETVFIHQNLHG